MSDAETRFALRAAAGRLLNRVRVAFDNDGQDLEVSQANPLPVAIVSGSSGGSGSGLTDTQLRAAPVPVALDAPTLAALENTTVAISGTPTVELGAASLAALENTTVTVGAPLPAGTNNIGDVDVLTVPAVASTTRRYDFGGIQRLTTAGAGAVRSTAVAAAEATLISSVRGFYRVGDSTVVATVGAGSAPLPADMPFTLQITSGQFISFIRDGAADGSLSIMPVAP